MIIQGLLIIGLLLSTCDISAVNQTPPNKRDRSRGNKRASQNTPIPPRSSVSGSGANAAAAAPSVEDEAIDKTVSSEEAVSEAARLTGISKPDAKKLIGKKAQVVGNDTLREIQVGTSALEKQVNDLQTKLAASEKELAAARASNEVGSELSDLRREKSELTDRVTELQKQLTAVNSKTANLEALAKQADADKDKIQRFTELQRAQCAAETARQELALEKDRIAKELEKALNDLKQRDADLKKATENLEDARSQAQKEAEEAEQELGRNLSLKNTELIEARKALEEASARAQRESKEAAQKVADLARDLKTKEDELRNAKAAPVGNEGAEKEKKAIEQALADLDNKYKAAEADRKKAEEVAADARRKLDEANVDKEKNKDQGAIRKERDVAQANAKFYKNMGMTAAGALVAGGVVLLVRTFTGGSRVATRVKADEMISFIAQYEGAANELVTKVVENFGEPAKPDRAMYVKLNEKLVRSIDLLEEFLSWKSEPVSQEFIEAEDALLRLLMVRTALLKLMPAEEPVVANEAAAAA